MTKPLELPRTEEPYALELDSKLDSELDDDIHDRPTVPTLPVVVPPLRKKTPKIGHVYKTPAAAFFAGCDAWEYRPNLASPSDDHDETTQLAAGESYGLWWISEERRRWLARGVFATGLLALTAFALIALLLAATHGK